jgi:hypothetical protein
MADGLDERIRRRAYEIWEAEGRPAGRDEEHWHRAAEEVRAEARAETAVGGQAPDPAAPGPSAGSQTRPAETPPTKSSPAKPAGKMGPAKAAGAKARGAKAGVG